MQEYYYQLIVRPASHYDLFCDFLSDTLPVGFEEIENAFIIRSEDDLSTIAWGIEQFSEALSKALTQNVSVELELSREKNDDWIAVYRQHITAVSVPPFYIHPTWDTPKKDALNIALDPALAFGTGHHPTTAGCLQSLAMIVKENDTVLDVGCGSGILAIAAAKLGATVDACDSDELSIANTRENVRQNGMALRHMWVGSANGTSQQYDVVIANIVADVLVFMAKDLKKVLKSGATLILSGILDKYEAKVLREYRDFKLVEKIPHDEWVTLILKGTT